MNNLKNYGIQGIQNEDKNNLKSSRGTSSLSHDYIAIFGGLSTDNRDKSLHKWLLNRLKLINAII